MSVLFLVLTLTLPYFGSSLKCYNCRTGYTTSEVCSNELPYGNDWDCAGPNVQCYQMIIWYNGGALRLVDRGCYIPQSNLTTGGFCENFYNPLGVIKFCKNCTEDFCNMDPIFFPVRIPDCYISIAP